MSWNVWLVLDPEPRCQCQPDTKSVLVRCCFVLVCTSCGEKWPSSSASEWSGNYTSNTSMMLQTAALAVGTVKDNEWVGEVFHGMKARDCEKHLSRCIAWMSDHVVEMEAMNPPNGWGKFSSYLPWLRYWCKECLENPNAKVYISR